MKEIIALARKDIKLLLRDKSGSFFVFFFPLLMATFFGVIFSGGGGGTRAIPIAVVDEDSTAQSMAFARKMDESDELSVLFSTREEAVSLVRGAKRAAYILLPEGFGQSRERMFWGEPASIEIGVDPSRKAESAMLQGLLTGYFMDGMMQDMTDPALMRGRLDESLIHIRSLPEEDRTDMQDLERFLVRMDTAMAELQTMESDSAAADSAASGWQPIEFDVQDVAITRVGPKNAFEITFPQALIWAMIGCAASFGISLVVERTRGTLIRLRIAPISLRQILAGKGLACLFAIVFVSAVLLMIGMTIFNVRPGSVVLLALAVFASAVCFVGLMMMLSVLGKTEASAGGIGWAVLLVMSMTGGGMVPIMFMPSWLRAIGSVSPVKWAILTMEGAVWRGFTVEAMVAHSALLMGIGVCLFLIGARLFKHTAA
jgi:ABC-2 type transport system permease protein